MDSTDSSTKAPAYSEEQYLRWEWLFKSHLNGKGAKKALTELEPNIAEHNLQTKEGRDNHRDEVKRFADRSGIAFSALNDSISRHMHLIDWVKALMEATPEMPFPTLMAAFKAKFVSRNNITRVHTQTAAFMAMPINPGEPLEKFYGRVRTAAADLRAIGGVATDDTCCLVLQTGIANTGFPALDTMSFNISSHPKPFDEWQRDMESWDDYIWGKKWAIYW